MSIESRKVTRFELLMDAGFGAQKAGDILIRAFAAAGKYVYIEPMIPAEISPPARTRPALSGVIIRLADFDITNIGNDTDLIIASHEIVLDRRLDDEETNANCKVLLDMGDKKANEESYEKVCKRLTKLGISIFPFELDDESRALIQGLKGSGQNMFYLGMLSFIYSMTQESIEHEIQKTFGKKLNEEIFNKNIQIFRNGYAHARSNVLFSYDVAGVPRQTEKILIDGNSSMSMGIIDAGIKLFSGYPITPASSIMHSLAKVFPSYGGLVHQAEDEIAAIGTAIGSYFGGVPSITCTSGPGLSLKQEFIGYATAAEIPLIVIDAQRSGPSTGMPTKTEQSDLPAVLFGSHGDNTKIVLSVANVIDCFYAPQMARYLTEKLRVPVMLMSDFQIANSYKIIDKPKATEMNKVEEIQDFVLDRFRMNRLPDQIEMVRDNQATPGTLGLMRRVTGLNSDRSGQINYFSKTSQRSHAVRNAKIHAVRTALRKPEMFGAEEGEILVIGWGSSRGAIEEAITNCRKDGISASGLHFRIVYPFPTMLKEIFSKFKKVVTVELSFGDENKLSPLCMLLRAETLVDVKPMISNATGRPIRPRVIQEKIKEYLS